MLFIGVKAYVCFLLLLPPVGSFSSERFRTDPGQSRDKSRNDTLTVFDFDTSQLCCGVIHSSEKHQDVPALTTSLSGAILFIENTGKKRSEHAF